MINLDVCLFLFTKSSWLAGKIWRQFQRESVRSPLFSSHKILGGNLKAAQCITGLRKRAHKSLASDLRDGHRANVVDQSTEHHRCLKASRRPLPQVATIFLHDPPILWQAAEGQGTQSMELTPGWSAVCETLRLGLLLGLTFQKLQQRLWGVS